MRVHALLPAKEKFTDSQSGAVATLVHDFLRKSESRDEAMVIGAPLDAPALGGLSYQPVKSWHRFLFGRNMGLARGYVAWVRSLPEDEETRADRGAWALQGRRVYCPRLSRDSGGADVT